MGQRLFLEQVIQDTIHQEAHKITDEVDVTTLKDYMQVKQVHNLEIDSTFEFHELQVIKKSNTASNVL